LEKSADIVFVDICSPFCMRRPERESLLRQESRHETVRGTESLSVHFLDWQRRIRVQGEICDCSPRGDAAGGDEIVANCRGDYL
jgi:hypothetical protein